MSISLWLTNWYRKRVDWRSARSTLHRTVLNRSWRVPWLVSHAGARLKDKGTLAALVTAAFSPLTSLGYAFCTARG